MKVYKVVDCLDGQYHSARMGGRVFYKIDEPTHAPDNTRLFCFKTLEEAQDFAWPEESIFEAEATEISFPKKITAVIGTINYYWKLRGEGCKNIGRKIRLIDAPKGTIFAKTITLKKLIKAPYV